MLSGIPKLHRVIMAKEVRAFPNCGFFIQNRPTYLENLRLPKNGGFPLES